ncbi:hypothetical protein PHSY_006848 [Pseudozyma hubeiensis SY62]|uniref:Uncharacterized protein n=1 Tax=Pseudozyma hubeiensis (strain SY62) TaxID=1305764 RepID=R9PCY4_PSEHS|nr:hypothetical protein PHSY_006848 [Pseudozyma hubeiensis SY62]GAC99248.1 hypothetical protein PHSY_006848 [Pseudozyma hubeiensis SY62]
MTLLAAATAAACKSASAARNATVASLSLTGIHEMTAVALATAADILTLIVTTKMGWPVESRAPVTLPEADGSDSAVEPFNSAGRQLSCNYRERVRSCARLSTVGAKFNLVPPKIKSKFNSTLHCSALYTQLSAPPPRTPGDVFGDAVSPDCDRVKQPQMLT